MCKLKHAPPGAGEVALQQVVAIEFLQRFDNFADLLGVVARGYQKGVGRVYHDEIPDPQERHDFSAGIHEVVVRIQTDGVGGGDVAAGIARQHLVDRVPASHVVPAEIGGGDAADMGGFFEHGVIDRDRKSVV